MPDKMRLSSVSRQAATLLGSGRGSGLFVARPAKVCIATAQPPPKPRPGEPIHVVLRLAECAPVMTAAFRTLNDGILAGSSPVTPYTRDWVILRYGLHYVVPTTAEHLAVC